MALVTTDVAVTTLGKVMTNNGGFRDVKYITLKITEDGYVEVFGKRLLPADTDKYLGIPQVQSPSETPDDYVLEGIMKLDQATAEALGVALLAYATNYGEY